MKELAKSAGFQNVQIVEEAESALRYVIADSGSALRKAFENMKEIKPPLCDPDGYRGAVPLTF